jgi:hypothetical protein
MTSDPIQEETQNQTGVKIGTILGGINHSILAGRDIINNIIQGGDLNAQQRIRNRLDLSGEVQRDWIDGVLHPSLEATGSIPLEMITMPEAVQHPWKELAQETRLAALPLNANTSLSELLAAAQGRLLLLGGPGGGKTTTLLQLAEEMLEAAQHDPLAPIPTVFKLASFKANDNLEKWLERELKLRYHFPARVTSQWIENDELLLLLDGLDEVRPEARAACMREINAFSFAHHAKIVVTSRELDYMGQETRLALDQCIGLRPLRIEQVEAYLKSAGEELEGVRQAIAT